MSTLNEEVEELLGGALYVEKKNPNFFMPQDYWNRVVSACEQARQVPLNFLNTLCPDETKKSWHRSGAPLERVVNDKDDLCGSCKHARSEHEATGCIHLTDVGEQPHGNPEYEMCGCQRFVERLGFSSKTAKR